jgi:hypothetical protein
LPGQSSIFIQQSAIILRRRGQVAGDEYIACKDLQNNKLIRRRGQVARQGSAKP